MPLFDTPRRTRLDVIALQQSESFATLDAQTQRIFVVMTTDLGTLQQRVDEGISILDAHRKDTRHAEHEVINAISATSAQERIGLESILKEVVSLEEAVQGHRSEATASTPVVESQISRLQDQGLQGQQAILDRMIGIHERGEARAQQLEDELKQLRAEDIAGIENLGASMGQMRDKKKRELIQNLNIKQAVIVAKEIRSRKDQGQLSSTQPFRTITKLFIE